MALSLNATLDTAQDAQTRHPLVEIKSYSTISDIPFAGTFLTNETFDEYDPAVIAHSDGRLCLAYLYGPDPASSSSDEDIGIKYVYSDINRSYFTTVTIPLYDSFSGANYTLEHLSLCEMADGNIGMVLLIKDLTAGTNYYILYRIITVEGEAVSDGEIDHWSTGYWTSDPYVYLVEAQSSSDSDAYMVVFTKQSASNYIFQKYTSSDFESWTGPTTMSIGGLTSTLYKRNCSLIQISTGDLYLFFDYTEEVGAGSEELRNIYYSVSSDLGATWSDAIQVTEFDTFAVFGSHPQVIQKETDYLTLLFTKHIQALLMDDTASGWPSGDMASMITIDQSSGYAYITCVYSGVGDKYLQCIVKVDLDNWVVLDYWDTSTSPAFLPIYASQHVWYAQHTGEGHFIPVATIGTSATKVASLLDGEANTITDYIFETNTTHNLTKNIDYTLPNTNVKIMSTCVDADNERLYVFLSSIISPYYVIVGYFSLTDAGPTYTFNVVVNDTVNLQEEALGFGTGNGYFKIYPEEDMIIISSYNITGGQTGCLLVYDITSGGQIKYYRFTDYAAFPYHGIKKFEYKSRHIYGGISYNSGNGQDEYRGLVDINLDTDLIQYHRPSYVELDDYNFYLMDWVDDNNLLITHTGYGVAIYNLVGDTWALWSCDNVPGLVPDDVENFMAVRYYESEELIVVGKGFWGDTWNGISMFSLYGPVRQAQYKEGSWGGATWDWEDENKLVIGYRDYDMVAVVEPGTTTSMYCFWVNETVDGELSIKWAKDNSTFDLSSYLFQSQEIICRRSIDGGHAMLTFAVSEGHLFDPYNQNSLFSLYLKKGRKLILRWGEKVSGSSYWQDAGTFFVTETSVKYKRGVYTIVSVTAEDERCMWGVNNIIATDHYDTYPESILSDLLQDNANFDVDRINLPTFDNRVVLEHQWIDTALMDIIAQICNRFGYFFRMNVDNEATARKISNEAEVDHTYLDTDTIIEYTPDDKYSDFTNRVVVTGQELAWTEVMYGEERITNMTGTVGWWGYKKDFTIYYSDDGERKCRYPRLDVLETATSIGFKLAGTISEEITSEDVDYRYCIVTITAPNLIPLLLAGIAILGSAYFIPDGVVSSFFGGVTIPIGRIVEQTGVMLCLLVLGAVGNYQYDIYASPLGNIRRSVQNQADDLEHQTEINNVVLRKFEDPLCYSVSDCGIVAEFELMVAKAQRRRVKITKVTHLQDEEGDTIRFPHPYSGNLVNVFITDLERRMRAGSGGYFLDAIEGWLQE